MRSGGVAVAMKTPTGLVALMGPPHARSRSARVCVHRGTGGNWRTDEVRTHSFGVPTGLPDLSSRQLDAGAAALQRGEDRPLNLALLSIAQPAGCKPPFVPSPRAARSVAGSRRPPSRRNHMTTFTPRRAKAIAAPALLATLLALTACGSNSDTAAATTTAATGSAAAPDKPVAIAFLPLVQANPYVQSTYNGLME